MSERLTPPYIDLHERGSYDTDELDALEAAAGPLPDPYNWARIWTCACGVERINVGWIKCQKCEAVSPMRYEIESRDTA